MTATVYTKAEVDALVKTLQGQVTALASAVAALQQPTPTPAPTPTPTPTPAPTPTGLTAGQWNEVQGSALPVYSGPLAAAIHGNTGPSAIMASWSGAAYDDASESLVVWGGGHTDYSGNEVYAFHLKTLTWSELTQPSSVANYDGSGVLPDGAPSSRHTYDGLVALGGKLIAVGGGILEAGGAGGFASQCWELDLATLKWTRMADPPALAASPGICACADPATNTVVAASISGVARFDPARNTWAQLGNGQLTDYHMTGAVDPVHGQMVCVSQSNLNIVNLATGQVTSPTPKGDLTLFNKANAPGVAWYAPESCFVLWDGGATLYKLDPLTWTFAAFPIPGTMPAAAQANGTFGRFRYSQGLNLFVLVNDVGTDVQVFEPPFPGAAPVGTQNQAIVTSATGTVHSFTSLASAQAALQSGDVVDVIGSVFQEGISLAVPCTLNLHGPLTFQNATVDGGVGLIETKADVTVNVMGAGPVVIQGVRNSDGNGSGIRQTSGALKVTGSQRLAIQGCDMGVLSSVQVTSTFLDTNVSGSGCGQNVASSLGHNFYLQGGHVTFRGSSRDAAFGGHELKCRAPSLLVSSATIVGGSQGTDNSRLIDMANGGQLTVENSVLTQGAFTENAEIIGYAEEGLTADGRVNSIAVTGCTVVSSRTPSQLIVNAAPSVVPTLSGNSLTGTS